VLALTKRYSTFGFGMALFPAASSMRDPNSAAVVLHIALGNRPFYLGQVWTGPCVLTVLRSPPAFVSSPGPVSCYVSNEGVREFIPDFGSAVNGVFLRNVSLAADARDTSSGKILRGLETIRSAWPTSSLSVLVVVPNALLLCPNLVSCSLDHAARSDC
jgi:hypothetical protein